MKAILPALAAIVAVLAFPVHTSARPLSPSKLAIAADLAFYPGWCGHLWYLSGGISLYAIDIDIDPSDGVTYGDYSVSFQGPESWTHEEFIKNCISHVGEACAMLDAAGFEVGGIDLSVSGTAMGIIRCR